VRRVEDVALRLVAQFEACSGPLSRRTFIVPGGRTLHIVRRALLQTHRLDVLAGLEAVTTLDVARTLLRDAAVEWSEGEERMRPARIARLLESGWIPAGFDARAIATARGWDRAFSRAIGELEAAGLRPESLTSDPDPRTRGVAALWRELDSLAAAHWTRSRMLAEARRRLVDGAAKLRTEGRVVALVDADLSPVEQAFIDAMGTNVEWIAFDLRPIDGPRTEPIAAAQVAAREGTALHRLQCGLFEAAAQGELDESVVLEQHEGIDRELDAAARWVAERIENGIPVEDIAVLTADAALIPMIHDRIAALGDDNPIAIHVAGGLSIASMRGGARALEVLRALECLLNAESMWRLLPSLVLAESEDPHASARRSMSRGDAWWIAFRLGTMGGHAGAPRRALQWPARARARIDVLRTELATSVPLGVGAEDHKQQARLLDVLCRVLPALDAMDSAMAAVLDGLPLAGVSQALSNLFSQHVHGARGRALNLLASVVEQDAPHSDISGAAALEYCIELMTHVRVPTARFGEPAVFVGSLTSAASMSFRAIRIIGLAEGTVPPRTRPDVVLAEEVRVRLGLSGQAERAVRSRRRFHGAVLSASQQVVLSCARVGLDRIVRQPAPVFVDVLRATADADRILDALRATFRDGRSQRRRAQIDHPLRRIDRLVRAAELRACPREWLEDPVTGVLSLRAIGDAVGGPADGIIGSEVVAGFVSGLATERPISASRLNRLLQCPWRYLLDVGLLWKERDGPPPITALDAMQFGTLVHTCIERFGRESGAAFERREGEIDNYVRLIDEVARQECERLRESIALLTDDAWQAQLDRTRKGLRAFLEHEWHRRAGAALEPERAFGYPPEPSVEIVTEHGSMWLRGSIDRMRTSQDELGPLTEVWDVKSGKCRGGREPEHIVDVQIGVYSLVSAAMARAWEIPDRVEAGYVFTNHERGPERNFLGAKATELGDHARVWLGIARHMLAEGELPRTPRDEDCSYCDMRMVCGPRAPVRAESLLRHIDGPLRSFAALKGLEDDAP